MLVVGIDLGTQSCKAVVCDEHLVVRGKHSVPLTTRYPQPGWAEQDPRAWEAALAPAIAGALERAGGKPDQVVALAIAGQLDGCVAVDASCTPLHPCLIWQDRRATGEATFVPAATVFAITGQVSDASHLLPKATWLRAMAGVTAARFHQPVSYLVERLTGEAVIDHALASSCMAFELATRRWSPAMLDAYDLTASELPEVRDTCSVAGELTAEGARLTGLPTGVLVAVGTGDDFANPLGAGITGPGPIAVTLGTAEVVGAVSTDLVLDRATEPMVETHAYPSGGYFVENPGWLSGGAIEWAVKLLGVADAKALDALAASDSEGVIFVPALAGAMTPVWRPHARGTFHGLTASHGREHLARAVLEGLAFACRDVVGRLGEMRLPRDRVVLVGGGAYSPVWAQIRADVLGLRHDVIANPDTSPLGAAMIASVVAGIHPDLVAAARVTPSHTRFEPVARLDEAYERYRRLVAALASLSASRW